MTYVPTHSPSDLNEAPASPIEWVDAAAEAEDDNRPFCKIPDTSDKNSD